MSDNASVTGGLLTDGDYAFDNISGVRYGRGKITLGQDGVNTADWAGRAVGTDGIAYVDPRPDSVDQAQNSAGLTIATTAYGIGETLGTGWVFTNMVRVSAGRGRVKGIALLDKGDVMTSATLYFASGSITFGTDNVAPAVSDTDAEKIMAAISIGVSDLGGSRFGAIDSLTIPYSCDVTSLYVYAITNTANAIFTAVTDLRLRLFIERD